MRHIRDNHNIEINGSKQKQELLNIGYYHGYKASRFIKERDNTKEFQSFDEIKAIYDFDSKLKSLFYPYILKIETSLKNRLIDYLVRDGNSSLEYIYSNKLSDHTRNDLNNNKRKKYTKKNLDLRGKMDSTIAYNYGRGTPVINHFFHEEKPLPIWAYFEVISMGEFGNFVSCLHKDYRIKFTEEIGLHHTGLNQNGRMIENIVFTISDLRNAVMHNSIIFDCRFDKQNHSNQIKEYTASQTGIRNINFTYIIDYLILLVYLSHVFSTTTTELKGLIREYDKAVIQLNKSINRDILFEIIGTEDKIKSEKLKQIV